MPLATMTTISWTPLGRGFERNALDTFVVYLAADVAQETLTLTLIRFIDSSIARSSWKVLVSLHWFSWSFQEVHHWVVCDVNRPNVPRGDDAAALLAGLYEVTKLSR